VETSRKIKIVVFNEKSRFTETQIVNFLKEAEVGLAVEELSRKHGFGFTELSSRTISNYGTTLGGRSVWMYQRSNGSKN
jgi:hypothetical protein